MKKIIVIMTICLLFAGCATQEQSLKEKMAAIDATAEHKSTTEAVETTTEEVLPEKINYEGKTGEELMKDMTLEEKVAQLFIVDFYSYNKFSEVTKITPELTKRLLDYPVGGVIFFGKNIVDQNQVVTLINDIQLRSKMPLFVSVDEEGGLVSRLGNNPAIGMTTVPTAAVIGATGDVQNAYKTGAIIGSELSALGFNVDFAPIADVNTNPDNPIIGDRAFSSDQNVVGEMVVEFAKGLEEQGVAAFAKHFPGHGDTSTDTHTGSVFVEHDRARLDEIEFVPFIKAIENGVSGVMVAHIALPNVTGTDDPASLSYEIVTGILREDLDYQGVVITDALNMGAVAETTTADVACVKALLAGVDILLMPEEFELGYKGVIAALQDGTLTEARIDESVLRILNLKLKLNLFKNNVERQPITVIGSDEHKNTITEMTQ